jgi:hypothetical protein
MSVLEKPVVDIAVDLLLADLTVDSPDFWENLFSPILDSADAVAQIGSGMVIAIGLIFEKILQDYGWMILTALLTYLLGSTIGTYLTDMTKGLDTGNIGDDLLTAFTQVTSSINTDMNNIFTSMETGFLLATDTIATMTSVLHIRELGLLHDTLYIFVPRYRELINNMLTYFGLMSESLGYGASFIGYIMNTGRGVYQLINSIAGVDFVTSEVEWVQKSYSFIENVNDTLEKYQDNPAAFLDDLNTLIIAPYNDKVRVQIERSEGRISTFISRINGVSRFLSSITGAFNTFKADTPVDRFTEIKNAVDPLYTWINNVDTVILKPINDNLTTLETKMETSLRNNATAISNLENRKARLTELNETLQEMSNEEQEKAVQVFNNELNKYRVIADIGIEESINIAFEKTQTEFEDIKLKAIDPYPSEVLILPVITEYKHITVINTIWEQNGDY